MAEVYPAAPLVRAIAAELVAHASGEDVDEARVVVERTADGSVSVVVTIGISAGHPVPDVLRCVGDAVRASLTERDPDGVPPAIDVKASRIDTGRGGA